MDENTMYMGATLRSDSGTAEDAYEREMAVGGKRAAGESGSELREREDPDGDQKFYLCGHCGNLVGMLNDSGVRIRCCGQDMERLFSNAQGDVKENLPVVRFQGKKVYVDASRVPHSVGRSDHIGWAYVKTDLGGHRQILSADGKPEAEFTLGDGEHFRRAFVYSSRHGLWSTPDEGTLN